MVDVVLDVAFPRQPSYRQRTPARAEIRQVDHLHEMAVIDYDEESGTQQTFREGTPVVISWGSQRRPEVFVGYVLYTRQRVENDEHRLRVVCIAPTQDFKDAEPAVLTNVTLDQALAQFALANGFEVALAGLDPHVYESISWTSGESGWQFFVRLAKRRGYSLFANRTTIFCYDPVKVMLADVDSLPLLTFQYGHSGSIGDLSSFTPQRGGEGAGKMDNRDEILLGIDPRSAAMIGVSASGDELDHLGDVYNTPRYRSFVQGQPVAGTSDAQERIIGMQRANRWTASAKATAFGQTKIRQGRGVVISGVDPGNDGLWYTHGVTHIVDRNNHPSQWRYVVELDLLRDSDNLAAQTVRRARPQRALAYSPDPSSSLLQRDRWKAAQPQARLVLA